MSSTLHEAIKAGDYTLAREIISNENIDLNEKFSDDESEDDLTYLHYYLLEGPLDISFLEFMVENGADLNILGRMTCLEMVIMRMDMDYGREAQKYMDDVCKHIRKMVQLGSNIHQRDDSGSTVLLSMGNKDRELIRVLILLVELGANIDDKDPDDKSLIHDLFRFYGFRDITLCRQYETYVVKKSNVNSRDMIGNTPLHYICSGPSGNRWHGNEYVSLLVSNGADVNVRNIYGETPIFSCDDEKSFLSLINHGADIGILSDENETPLFKCKDLGFFISLIENGVNINQKNIRGMTIHEVLEFESKYTSGRKEILSYLNSAQKIAMWARMIMAKNRVYMKRMSPDNLFAKEFSRKRMKSNGMCEKWIENVNSNT